MRQAFATTIRENKAHDSKEKCRHEEIGKNIPAYMMNTARRGRVVCRSCDLRWRWCGCLARNYHRKLLSEVGEKVIARLLRAGSIAGAKEVSMYIPKSEEGEDRAVEATTF